jgi:hypothetical protein
VALLRRCPLRCRWRGGDAARPTIETHTVDGRVVIDDGLVVGVVNNRRVYMGDSSVIGEMTAVPTTACETDASVAEAVVHATVEAHCLAPVAGTKSIYATVKSPVPRRPQ